MKIVIESLQKAKEFELRMIEFLLESPNFFDDWIKVINDQSHPIHKLSQGALSLIINKLDQYIERVVNLISEDQNFNCNLLLNLIICMMEFDCYRNLFNSLDHLFNILAYSNSLFVYEKIMIILIKLYKQPQNDNNIQQSEQLEEYLPRVIYFTKILFDHYNNLSSTKIDLIDYFNQDPQYKNLSETQIEFPQLILEYMEPSLLNESYQDLCKYGIHKKDLHQPISIRNFLITQVDSITALDLSQSFLDAQNQNFCPLIDAMKYKILIYREYQSNRIPTINIVIALHVQSLLMYMILYQFCSINDYEEELLNEVFEEQLEYDQHFRMYMKLFQLKTVEPQLLSNILLTLNEISKIEKQNQPESTFSIAKKYDETFLQLINDVLSMNLVFNDIEQTYRLEYFPTLLNEQCARNQELAINIFKMFSTEPLIFLLNKSNIVLASTSALIRSLSIQDNRLLLPPETFKAAIILLSRIIRKDDIQKDRRIFNDLINIVENQIHFSTQVFKPGQNGYLIITTEEADQIVATCIQSINENFIDDQERRSNRCIGPTFARQVSESTIIMKLQNLIECSPNFHETFQQTLILISHLTNQVPTLIGRLIDSHLPQTVNQLIQNISVEKINNKMMMAIFSFYINISLKDEGYEQFKSYGLQFLEKILNYLIINNINAQREQLSSLSQCITKFTQKIVKVEQKVCDILNNIIKQLWMHVSEKKKLLTISKIYPQYCEIITQIQNLSILSFNMFFYFTRSFLAKMIVSGFFESLLKFFEFPIFDFQNELLRVHKCLSKIDEVDYPPKILKKTLLTIENWEVYLGCNLDKAQSTISELFYDLEKFFSNCSQEQIQKKIEMASYYSQVEYLLQILDISFENSSDINWDEKDLINLHNKCCSLFKIVLEYLKQQQGNGVNDQMQKKQKFNLYLSILERIIVKTLRIKTMDDQQPFINLLNYLTLYLKNDNIFMVIMHLSFVEKFLQNVLNASELKKINLCFMLLLMKSGFTSNFYVAFSQFVRMTILINEQQNDLLKIFSKHYSNIIQILYIQNFEQQNKELGYFILIFHIQNIQDLLQLSQHSNSKYLDSIKFVLLKKMMKILSPTFLEDIIIKEKGYDLRFGDLNLIYQTDQLQKRIGLQNDIQDSLCLSNNKEKVQQIRQEMKQNLQNEYEKLQVLEEIQCQQRKLKNYIQQNILDFNNFEESLFKLLDGQMMPCLLKCLKKTVQEQLKLELQIRFEDCEIELSHLNYDFKLIITILHYIYKQQNLVQDYDYIVIEMIKLIQELLKYKNNLKIQALNHVLAILTLFITDEYQKKQQNYTVFNEIFEGIISILTGELQNDTTSKICIEILVRAFQINNENVHKFVYQMRGLEHLLKLKGQSKNQLYSLTNLVLSIVHDSNIVIAQIEAKIKKILYDQQCNLEINRDNQQIQQQYPQNLINSPFKDQYPLCYQPIHYNIKLPNEIKLAKDNEALLALQSQVFYKEQIQFVLNSLFEDQPNYFVLKKNVKLYTFDCVEPISFQKYKEPLSSKRSNNKPSSKKSKSENSQQLQQNFLHTKETQILIKLLIQQMIVSYFEKTVSYQFSWNIIIQVIQVLIRRYPILIPQLVRINCSKFLKPYHKQLDLEYSEGELPSKISFITLITKIMIPKKKLLFELCLDNLILNQISNNFVAPFSIEIRKKIINEIYVGIEKRIKNLDQNFCYLSDALVYLIQIKSVAKICIKNVNDLQNSYNFFKLYIEGMKCFNVKTYYIYENELIFLNESLAILLNVATYLLLSKPSQIPIQQQQQEQQGAHFQLQGMIGQLLPEDINYQLIPNKGIIYQNPIKYFKKWPILPISQNNEINLDVKQDQIDLQHLWSPFRRRNRFLDIDVLDIIDEVDFEIDDSDEDDNNYSQSSESRYDQSNIQESREEEIDQINNWITGLSRINFNEAEDTQNQNSIWTDEDDDQVGQESQDEELEENCDNNHYNQSNCQSNLLNQQNLNNDHIVQNESNLNQQNTFISSKQNNRISENNIESPNNFHHLTNKEELIFMQMITQIIQFKGVNFSQQFVQIFDKFGWLLPKNQQLDQVGHFINWWTELTQQNIIPTFTEEKDDRLLATEEQGRLIHINQQEIMGGSQNQQIQHSIRSEDQSIFQEKLDQSISIQQQQNTSTIESQNLQYIQSEYKQQQRQQNQQSSFCYSDFSNKIIQTDNLNQFSEEPDSEQQQSPYFDQSNIQQQNNYQIIINQLQKVEQINSPVQLQQNQQNNHQNYSQIYPKTYCFLKRVGKTFDDLIKNDIDPSVFENLNADIMMEIIQVIPLQTQGIDPSFLASLPQEIRNEISEQYFAPQLKVQEEDLSQVLNEGIQRDQDNNPSINNFQETSLNSQYSLSSRSLMVPHIFQDRQRYPIQEELKQFIKPHQKFQKIKNRLHNQRQLIQILGTVEDDFIDSLLSLLYVQSHSFINFPINLFISLCNNQIVEHKLMDTLFFILKTNNLKEQEQSFPPKFLVQRNGLIRDFKKIYNVVSLKVLYLFSKLQDFNITYFFQSKNQNQQNESSCESDSICPLLQLIQLLPKFQGEHLQILIQAIMNISSKQKDFMQENPKLDSKSVECICKFLISNTNQNVKDFSNIIQSLCNNTKNQILIVEYIKECIAKYIQEINWKFQRQFQNHEIFYCERTMLNVFQFLKEINLKEENSINQQEMRQNFNQILESPDLIELWKNIIKFLQQIPTQEIIKLIPQVSPYLECFFINYQIINLQQISKSNQKESKKKIAIMEGYNQEIQEQQLHDELFEEICEKGKGLLNIMIKERLQECKEKGRIKNDSLGIIISKNPKIVDFDNKQKYFKMKLKHLKYQNNKHHFKNIIVKCRRKDIFMDSYHHFSKLKPDELKGKLLVEFDGEEGVDQGGVAREWFLMLSKEIFNPNYALFTPSLNGQMFQPSNKSHFIPNYLKYFKFIGRIVAKALYDGQLLETYFTRSFYKHILGQKLTINDMEDIDLNEYKSMKKILTENVTDWGIYWTYTVDNFGIMEERELVEGGKQKQVTEDNKYEYVQIYCYQKMAKEIKDQIEAFLSGFHELIPQNLISMFEWKEMELMLCGLPDIDLKDMKENVEYHGYNNEDPVIKWLWELLESFDESKKAAFLQFITGTSKVPLGGFKDLKGIHGYQKIQIHREFYQNYELPTSHTCFNQLNLPSYPTRQVLIEKLELAILEGKEGFGFA